MTGGEKLLLIAAAAGGAYLLSRPASSPGASSSAPGGTGTIADPGGGAAVSPLSPPSNFPVYGPGSSSVPVAAAVGAQSAPPAGQLATLRAIAAMAPPGGANISTRNTSGAGSTQAELAGIAARAPIGGPNISTRQFYVPPTPVASAQAIAEILATSADYSTAAHIRPGIPLAPSLTAGGVPLTKAAAAQVIATSADYATAAHVRPPTPTDILAAQAAQAQANAFKAAIAQPHPSIASRTTYRPPPTPPPPPPRPAPVVNAQGQRRTSGGQLV